MSGRGSVSARHQLTTPQPSIIFIHGLTGDREKTWTAKNATAPWLQILLPSKISNARVLTFGYDASVIDLQGMVSKNRIGNHSWNLLTAIATYREDDSTVGRTKRRCLQDELMTTEQPPYHIRLP